MFTAHPVTHDYEQDNERERESPVKKQSRQEKVCTTVRPAEQQLLLILAQYERCTASELLLRFCTLGIQHWVETGKTYDPNFTFAMAVRKLEEWLNANEGAQHARDALAEKILKKKANKINEDDEMKNFSITD